MKISTGSELLDDFLEGGYERDILITIYGPSSSGKTTLCLLAAIAQAKEKKKVLFIDSEGGFSIDRFKQLAGEKAEDFLKYIMLLKPTTFLEQDAMLHKLKNFISQKIGLIIVDTLTLFYRLELAKNTSVKETNNKLIWQVSYLTEIARKNNVPVIATNQVYADFHNKNDIKMVGGDILRYRSKCLIKLEKSKQNKRKAVLVTHRSIPEGKELEFGIINEGIIGMGG